MYQLASYHSEFYSCACFAGTVILFAFLFTRRGPDNNYSRKKTPKRK